MAMRIRLPAPVGGALLLGLLVYFVWWAWTFNGPAGELLPRSEVGVLFPILGNSAIHTKGYTWVRQGDTIVLDYDVKLVDGYFSLTVGKTRWFARRLLRHEQNRSFRSSAAGQLRYTVRENGRHAIWAGSYSVWSGEARVRWSVIVRPTDVP